MIRENRLYDELEVGETASIKRVCTANDLVVFAHSSGNLNPLHCRDDEHDDLPPVAPSMWVGALVSSVLGNVLPGPGTLYRSQHFEFVDRVHVGDELTVTVTVREKLADNTIAFDTVITGRGGDTVAHGVAEVLAPAYKVRLEDGYLPELLVQRHKHFDRYLELSETLPRVVTAVVAPEEDAALVGRCLPPNTG